MKFEEEEEEEGNKLMEMVETEDDNRESNHLVSKYFFVPKLKHLLEYFNRYKNDKKKNHLVNIIKSGLKDLNNEIKEMSEEERANEGVDKIIGIIERILAYIKQQQKKEGQGIKILTPSQMLSRLPISLAQLEAGNNSKKN